MDFTHTGGGSVKGGRWVGRPNSPTVNYNLERQRVHNLNPGEREHRMD